ncbi:MAG: GNAT family N-acetyltransferase [Polyangiales bacterium]
MEVSIQQGLDDIDAAEWDAVSGENDPFVEHAFLHALETSGSVGGKSGWHPMHLVARDKGILVGAMPLYLKEHSYGEYIFDWSWAGGAERAGIPYYPKLVSMAPLTPATGHRFLVHPARERGPIVAALLEGVLAAAEATDASSIHLLFLNDEEIEEVRRDKRFMPRLSMQYHWHGAGDADFDAYLARFRSSMRKKTRKERRRVTEAGLRIEVKTGDALTPEDWHRLRSFYADTCARKGSFPYLEDSFFEIGAKTLGERAVAVFAYEGEPGADERCVAGTLNFEKGGHLYGRYWGCEDSYDMLHFELCYYQLIERAIAQGMTRFEAGAQGSHKLRRGLMPSKVHSAHWIKEPELRRAIAEFLPHEAHQVARRIAVETGHGPFRRDEDAG